MSVADRRLALVAGLIVSLLSVGCASRQVVGLRSQHAPETRLAAPTNVPASCRFSLAGIDDQRDTQDLGQMGPTRIDGEGLVQWLADGITAMPGYSPEPAPATIRISFLKAYMQGLGTLKSANLVVRLQVTSGDLAPTNKNYRGVDRSLNWSNGEAEIQEGFERARIDLATQIAADLKKRCSG